MMKYWDNVTEIYDKQRKKGIETYGQTLEDNKKLSIVDIITMAQEELVDLLMYLEKLKEIIMKCKFYHYIPANEYEPSEEWCDKYDEPRCERCEIKTEDENENMDY